MTLRNRLRNSLRYRLPLLNPRLWGSRLVGCINRPIDSEVINRRHPPFTFPLEGREARFLHRSHRELNHGPSRARGIP